MKRFASWRPEQIERESTVTSGRASQRSSSALLPCQVMPYSATAHRLLLNAPSDIPEDDVSTVLTAAMRWNVAYGPHFGAVVIPTHWSRHAVAEHGRRAQERLFLAIAFAGMGIGDNDLEHGISASEQSQRDLEYVRAMLEFGHNDARHVYILVTTSLAVSALFAIQLFDQISSLPLGGRIVSLAGLLLMILAAAQFFLYLQARHLSWRDTAECLRTADADRAREVERGRIIWLFYSAAATLIVGLVALLVSFAWILL